MAIALPVLVDLYARTFEVRFGERPLERDVATVAHESYDLLTQGKGWALTQQAVERTAAEGHVFVSRVDRELLTAGSRLARAGEQPTQGQVLQAAYHRAVARQAELNDQGAA